MDVGRQSGRQIDRYVVRQVCMQADKQTPQHITGEKTLDQGWGTFLSWKSTLIWNLSNKATFKELQLIILLKMYVILFKFKLTNPVITQLWPGLVLQFRKYEWPQCFGLHVITGNKSRLQAGPATQPDFKKEQLRQHRQMKQSRLLNDRSLSVPLIHIKMRDRSKAHEMQISELSKDDRTL